MTTFDEYAPRYDSWFESNRNVLASELLLLAGFLDAPGRTLSVGCGSGLFELLLRREHGIEIREGIEPAAGMAEIARKRGMTVEIAGAEQIPFESYLFDTVLMNGIPAYLADLGAALAEVHRILKHGGRVVIGDVPASSGYGMLYRLAGVIGSWDDPRLQQIAPPVPYPIEFVRAASWRNTTELVDLLQSAGFEDLSFSQTLTMHPRYSNEVPQQPEPGYDKGGYVAIRAHKPRG